MKRGIMLVIPVMVNRRCVAIIRRSMHRNTKIKYTYSKGFRRNDVLFGQDLLDYDGDYVVLCEGPYRYAEISTVRFEYSVYTRSTYEC